MSDERLIKPFLSESSLDDDKQQKDIQRPIINKNLRGEPLPASQFPSRLAAYRHPNDAAKKYNKLPHFFRSDWVLVSEACADVLRQFELRGGCFPVDLYQEDRKTFVPGTFFHLNIGAVKNAVLPEESPGVSDPYGMGYSVLSSVKDDEVCVSSAALGGPDIWIDPILSSSIFFSDRLRAALKAAKVDTPFRAKRCLVLGK